MGNIANDFSTICERWCMCSDLIEIFYLQDHANIFRKLYRFILWRVTAVMRFMSNAVDDSDLTLKNRIYVVEFSNDTVVTLVNSSSSVG